LHSLSFLFTFSASPVLYPLSLHDALPIFNVLSFALGPIPVADPALRPVGRGADFRALRCPVPRRLSPHPGRAGADRLAGAAGLRSEEHTSELQSRENLVCRLLLEKKNTLD